MAVVGQVDNDHGPVHCMDVDAPGDNNVCKGRRATCVEYGKRGWSLVVGIFEAIYRPLRITTVKLRTTRTMKPRCRCNSQHRAPESEREGGPQPRRVDSALAASGDGGSSRLINSVPGGRETHQRRSYFPHQSRSPTRGTTPLPPATSSRPTSTVWFQHQSHATPQELTDRTSACDFSVTRHASSLPRYTTVCSPSCAASAEPER